MIICMYAHDVGLKDKFHCILGYERVRFGREKHLGDRKVFLLDSSEVAEYLDVWRPLKDGKNRPLFLDERQEEANRIRLVQF